MAPKPIEIVGGGLAGLALGIGLRARDVPVTVWEALPYPRHRVCGEVLSGAGCAVLERLGLLAPALEIGGCWARTAAFYNGNRSTPVRSLPRPALCIARYHLDQLLATRFRDSGGDLKHQRWHTPEFPHGIVRATGRPVQAIDGKFRWFGIKAHARNVHLNADVEMHLLESGYVGLCRLPEGKVNVCGLFRLASHRPHPTTHQEWLTGPADSALHDRLAGAEWEPATFCAVAGLPLRPRRAGESSECRLGDALTMISPVTGNGMSMALEAADCSAPILASFSLGELEWSEARAQVAASCDARFARRLRWAWLFQRALFSPVCRRALVTAGQSGWSWRLVFSLTR